MERETIINACGDIYASFEEMGNMFDEELKLTNFLTWITQKEFDFVSEVLNKSDLKLEGEHVEDVLTDGVWMPLAHTAFGLGFALGSLVEVSNPTVEEKIEVLRRIIKEAAFVPFVPRRRKT